MSDLLSIGMSGIKAYGRAIATVGDNIANAETPGYARRTADIRDQTVIGNRILYRDTIQPGGAVSVGVRRMVDDWRINEARASDSDAARTRARANGLAEIETALNDGPQGIGQRMTAFFNAADSLAADPNSRTERQNFLAQADQLASAFRTSAAQVDTVGRGILSDAQASAATVNTSLQALQKINASLETAKPNSTNQASLLDERDRLVDQVSGEMGVKASFDGRGIVSLTTDDGSGTVLLSQTTLTSLTIAANPDGTFEISAGGPPISPQTGRLAGLSTSANDVKSVRTSLDTLASDVASQINTIHQIGRDANRNPGTALFDASLGAGGLQALISDPDLVAAADASSENGTALSFATLRGRDGPEGDWASLVSQHGLLTSNAKAQDAAATARQSFADEARAAMSAVDLDEEAAELLRYQQAFEGAARTIQVARETIQSILNIF